MQEFSTINNFLYTSLALLTAGGALTALERYKLKANELAKNKIKDYREIRSGKDGMRISKNIQLEAKKDYEGILMLAPTGAGKTTSLFLNNLLSNDIKGSFIVTDPKGELFELTSGYQKEVCKRKVYKLDFNNVDYSENYNLLEQCRNSEEVMQLSSNLLLNGSLSIELSSGKRTGGMEWIQMSESLLSSVLLYCYKLGRPYNNIEFALQLILTLDTEQLKKLIGSSNNLEAITQFNIFQCVGGADRTEGSIKITLASNMKLFTSRDINRISNFTTIDINKFRKEPSILYVIYPERKSNYLSPFIAPFFTQIIDKLLDNYNKNSLPTHLLFDEFANIGLLNNMSINAATFRSRKISLVICLQSITQLYQVYGINNAKAILNNLKTKVILPGLSDIESINLVSNICGNIEINTSSKSFSKENVNINYSKSKRKMFEDGEIRTLETGKGLIIADNKMPVIDDIEPYYKSDLSKNVISPVKYKKRSYANFIDIRKEIDKIKSKTTEKVEEIENDNAGRILRGIFKEEV